MGLLIAAGGIGEIMRVAKILDSLKALKATGISIESILDVGVQHSTPALMEVFSDVPHILFEPIDDYYPHIHKNYAGFSYTLVEAAISDYDGFLNIKSERKTRGDEISHSYIVQSATSDSRKVLSTRLDTYIKTHTVAVPYLLKIDVDGPEVPSSILRGAREALGKASVVVIEMTVDKFMDRAILLHEQGFDVWDICDLCYYGNCLWQADVVFVRRDIKKNIAALSPMSSGPFRPNLWQSGF